jgi:hypothetical protein
MASLSWHQENQKSRLRSDLWTSDLGSTQKSPLCYVPALHYQNDFWPVNSRAACVPLHFALSSQTFSPSSFVPAARFFQLELVRVQRRQF